jgi:hypothetical protein
VRLIDGKALVKLKDAHPGDKARYNHQTQRAIWSPDEAWLIAVNESKWATDHANAYRIGRDSVSDPLDLRPLCEAAERRSFKSAGARSKSTSFSSGSTLNRSTMTERLPQSATFKS